MPGILGLPPSRSLVRSSQAVARLQIAAPSLPPGVAAVYVTVDGRAEQRERVLSRGEALSGRYRTMHLVDVTRHRTDVPADRVELPTRHDRRHFRGRVRVGWRVTDAATVVKEGIVEGDSIVEAWVLDAMRTISRGYDIDQCELAEREINQITAGGPVHLTGTGISVDHVSAHVTLDDITSGHYRDADLQQNQLELERLRMAAVAEGVQGEFGLITLHLRHHPTEAIQVLELMHRRQQELEQRQAARFTSSAELFATMADKGLLQNVDVDQIRDALLQNLVATVTAGASPVGSGPAPRPPLPGGGAASGGGAAPPAGPAPQPNAGGGSGVVAWQRLRP